ncbi:acetyltransferase [Lepidopterella palustris CBS 459.81]|uniref:Acetyltransferase n=1 Tax=Lepidopterella palustris CBS 459.81 TaxID=1314670 RepID=A0A8E2EA01_9PEZI|nr:acetyltransferase [Lepidopterella palustris CBS 459.81]
MASISIRRTKPTDFPYLQAIEKAACEAFTTLGMKAIAEDPPPSLEELHMYHDADHAWVATSTTENLEHADIPIAYILVYVIDNVGLGAKSAFIHQVSVSPDFSRRGIGRALIGHVEQWARHNAILALDLTTFRDVPWNRPYYEKLGFKTVDEQALLRNEYVGLRRAILCEWDDKLLGRWPRVPMRKTVIN